MSGAFDSPAVRDLLGEPFVLTFATDTVDEAADKCLAALINRYGKRQSAKALRDALARPRPPQMTRGRVINELMDALHHVLVANGSPDPTSQIEKLFSGDGPLGDSRKRLSVRRRFRRNNAKAAR